ncbi:MAG: Crp/Fnr family transcriptional regulator [Gemmatimonadota bacterium]
MPLSVLTAGELFRGTSEAEARRIAGLCAERHYPKGAVIFARDDPADHLYIVQDGLVRLVSISDKGAETILRIFKEGEIFGELLLAEERRAFTALVAEDARVAVLSRRNFSELLSSVPIVAENFIRLLSRRLTKVEREFAAFGHTWSYHRLAIILLDLARRHGVKSPRGTRIALRLTHDDLAKLIGTTRETVTTQMNRLSRKGMVRRDGRLIVIDGPRLRRLIGREEGDPEDGDAG